MPVFRRGRNAGDDGKELTESLLPTDERVDSAAPAVDENRVKSEPEREQHNLLLKAVIDSWNCFLALLAFLLGQHGQPSLTPTQAAALEELKSKVGVPYDVQNGEHLEALESLWRAGFPDTEFTGVKSAKWKEMGWQGTDPGTDFRGGGFYSLSNLLYMAYDHSSLFQKLMKKTDGDRAEWEYPFAAAGVNITVHLVDMMKLREEYPPSGLHWRGFLTLLDTHPNAFEELYCCAFELLDKVWLDMKASYMEFPTVLKRTMRMMEDALCKQPAGIDQLRQMLEIR